MSDAVARVYAAALFEAADQAGEVERVRAETAEFAAALKESPQMLGALLDRLERAGLVERRSTAADRRQYAIYLTAEGRAAAEQAIAVQHALIAATLGRLPSEKLAEFETLLIATRDLVRAYREASGRAPVASG